jgi:hypothetical protein
MKVYCKATNDGQTADRRTVWRACHSRQTFLLETWLVIWLTEPLFYNISKKYILQFFSSELSSSPTASSQSLSLSHSHDFMIHWPVVHWNWSAEHCCGAKVATQHRKCYNYWITSTDPPQHYNFNVEHNANVCKTAYKFTNATWQWQKKKSMHCFTKS